MTNEKLRIRMQKANVHIWELAQHTGLSECTLGRRLRHELSKNDAKYLLTTIDKIEYERAEAVIKRLGGKNTK